MGPASAGVDGVGGGQAVPGDIAEVGRIGHGMLILSRAIEGDCAAAYAHGQGPGEREGCWREASARRA